LDRGGEGAECSQEKGVGGISGGNPREALQPGGKGGGGVNDGSTEDVSLSTRGIKGGKVTTFTRKAATR